MTTHGDHPVIIQVCVSSPNTGEWSDPCPGLDLGVDAFIMPVPPVVIRDRCSLLDACMRVVSMITLQEFSSTTWALIAYRRLTCRCRGLSMSATSSSWPWRMAAWGLHMSVDQPSTCGQAQASDDMDSA
uniref:Uncharacterized protein n=1 Tax=Triticum urartu TaxID=4572 RepID=A0A8R7QAW2_TRIUA